MWNLRTRALRTVILKTSNLQKPFLRTARLKTQSSTIQVINSYNSNVFNLIRCLNHYLYCSFSLSFTLFIYFTDLWEDSKFIDCKLENTTFLHPKKGCHLNFQEENDILIYLVSFLGSLSVLPGNIIAGLLMDKIGRIKIIGEWYIQLY